MSLNTKQYNYQQCKLEIKGHTFQIEFYDKQAQPSHWCTIREVISENPHKHKIKKTETYINVASFHTEDDRVKMAEENISKYLEEIEKEQIRFKRIKEFCDAHNKTTDKQFDYSVIKVSHRFNINKPINSENFTLDKVIRTALVKKYSFQTQSYFWEYQISYRDDDNRLQCGIYKLDDYTIKVIKTGDAQIDI